jgi:iron complex outermembrane receptor protein
MHRLPNESHDEQSARAMAPRSRAARRSGSIRRAASGLAFALAACGWAVPTLAQLLAPRPLDLPAPNYPAGQTLETVHVLVHLRIDEAGKVTSARAVHRDPGDSPEAFADAAEDYALTLKFAPATRDGKPIKSQIDFSVEFERGSGSAAGSSSASPVVRPPSAASAASAASATPSPSSGASSRASAAPTATPAAATSSAAPPAASSSASASAEPSVIDVEVVARLEARSVGAADHAIEVGPLANVPRQNASHFLTMAPGILLTNEGGEGHAEQVFLRGFDAREGQDIEFTVDGVPINDSGNLHGNGYADTHFIIPEVIRSLRVIEGPFSPHQGNYAVAGSAEYQLGLSQRGVTAKATVGSFGAERLLLTYGPNGAPDETFGAVEIGKTDGYGQNRDAKRATAMGQYAGQLGKSGSYRIAASAYETSYHSAGVLREDDYDTGRVRFFDTYDPAQGGDSSRYSLSFDLQTASAGDIAFRQTAFLVYREMRLRENFTGFLLDPQEPTQSLHGQRGDLIDLHFSGVTAGATGFARWSTKVLGLPQEVDVGYFARGDVTSSTQYRLEASTLHAYRTDADLGAKLGDIGLYVDANLKLHKLLTLRGGLRADFFDYDVLNNCAVQSVARPSRTDPQTDQPCLSQEGFGAYREPFARVSTASSALMPRATLLFGPLHHFSFNLAYGRGVRSIDPSYVTQDAATPFATVDAYEGGVTYSIATEHLALTAKSSFFSTKVDHDLIFNETEGRNTLSSGTTRTGWAGNVRATGQFFDQGLSVTLVHSEFDDTHDLVPYVPDVVVRDDTALLADLPWKLAGKPVRGSIAAGLTYVGRRPLPYGQRSDEIFTTDGALSLAWRAFELALSVQNLFGVRYRLGEFNYASDFHSQAQPTLVPARHFTAGAPRTVFLSLSVNMGGK